MSSDRLIDLSPTARAHRRDRARRRWRLALPFVAVAAMAGVLLLISLYSYRANRRAALGLSRSLVGTLVQRIDTEVGGYLGPAADTVRQVGQLASRTPYRDDWTGLLEPVSVELMRTHPQLLMVYSGGADGSFVQATRMSDGRIDTKVTLRPANSPPRMYWIRRDPSGQVVRKEDQPFDNYDPRVRPWYRAAANAADVSWTPVYVFFDPRKPGVTASYPVRSAEGKLVGVIGADIVLEDLSAFLAHLKIGTAGRAVILDGEGRLVAGPDLARAIRVNGDDVHMARVAEAGDLVLTRAFNRFQIEGPGWRNVDVAGRMYLSSVTPLASSLGNGWSVLVVVPEEDFVGVVAHNSRNTLLMSLAVVAGAIALAVALGVMTLRSDTRARAVHEQRDRLRAQSEAYSRMAADPAMLDLDDPVGVERLTEAVAAAADVRRVSVWRAHDDGRGLVCDDAFDRAGAGHTRGAELDLRSLPEFVHAMRTEMGSLATYRAGDDERTAGLFQRYLRPLGLTAALLTPIRTDANVVGVLVLEDEERPAWHPEDATFAQAVAAILGVRCRDRVPVAIGAGLESAWAASPVDADAAPLPDHPRAADGTAEAPGAGAPAGDDNVDRLAPEPPPEPQRYADVTAMVVQLRPSEHNGSDHCDPGCVTLLDRVLCQLESLADARGVEHVTAAGDTVVCIAAPGASSPEPTAAIAELALRARQLACGRGTRPPLAVGIGIHCGPAVGAVVGRRVPHYEFAGEAVQVASLLAASCPAGGVQVSDAVYRRLRARYLLQERGRFYAVGLGEVNAYLLREAL